MTTRRNLFLSLGVAAIALVVAVPVAFSRGPGPGDHGDRMGRLAEKLGLDAKQTTQFKVLKDAQRDDAQSLREQVRAVRDAQKQLWLAPSPDRAKILAGEREALALEGQLAESRIDFMFKVRTVLTPAQFQKFIEMRKDGHFGKDGKRGWGKRHGRRGGPDSDGQQ